MSNNKENNFCNTVNEEKTVLILTVTNHDEETYDMTCDEDFEEIEKDIRLESQVNNSDVSLLSRE
jgi:hypothetical protein